MTRNTATSTAFDRAGTIAWVLALLVVLTLAGPSQAAPAPAAAAKMTLDQAFDAMVKYEFGQSRECLTVVDEWVRGLTGADDKKKASQRLLAVLKSGATKEAKRFVCRMLVYVGDADSVPTLAALLTDEDMSDMARYAMERINSPAVDAALRDAMGKVKARPLTGVIGSLGQRRDKQAVPALAKLLGDADVSVACAAAAALGRISGAEAAQALAQAKGSAKPELAAVAADAYLACADGLAAEGKKDEAVAIYKEMYAPTAPKRTRIAALRGLTVVNGEQALPLLLELINGADEQLKPVAIGLIQELSGANVTGALSAAMAKMPPAAQVAVLDALAARGDPAARATVMQAAQSKDDPVRLAAIKALGPLGDASAVPLLVKAAAGASDPERAAARQSLTELKGKEVDAALAKTLDQSDAKAKPEILKSLAARRGAGASATFLKCANDPDAGVRIEAYRGLGLTAEEKDLPAILKLLVKTPADNERDELQKAVGSTCFRIGDPAKSSPPVLEAIKGAEAPARCAMLRVLGAIGGPQALEAVRAGLKDGDAKVQEAAVKALIDWPDSSAADDALAVAKSTKDNRQQILALQAYIGMVRKMRATPDDRLKFYQNAMELAKRPEEKNQVLAGLAELPILPALKVVDPFLAEDATKEAASIAAVAIAEKLGAPTEEVGAVMKKVVQATKNKDLQKKAEAVIARVKKPKGAGGVDAVPAASPVGKVRDDSAAEKLGWRVAVQAYSFNRFTFFEAVDKAASVGIKYIELYPGQTISKDIKAKTDVNMTPEVMEQVQKKLRDAGVKAVAFGVTGVSGKEQDARKVFDFARKMGIEVIVTEAAPDAFKTLDKLTEEYGIRVALHNHPKPSYYWDADTVLKGVEGCSKRIGACADTGHWRRSGLVPLDCVKKLKGRIVSFHFKDLVDEGKGWHDVPWGTGKGDVKGILTELKDQGFKGIFSIEYEYNWDNSVPDIAKCVEFFDKTAAELAK